MPEKIIMHGGIVMSEALEKVSEVERVKMTVNTTAKGMAQWEVTVDFPSVEESAKNLNNAIDRVRTIIAEKGLTEAKEAKSS